MCRSAFTFCLEEAAGAVDSAREGATACQEENRTCISEAKDAKAVASCREKATECLTKLAPETTVPTIPGLADGGRTPPTVEIPGTECLTAMNDCVTAGDKDMFECAADARDCMLAAIPEMTVPTIPGIDLPAIDGGVTIPGLDNLPGADCIQTLRKCIGDGKKDPMECASDARTCMLPEIPALPDGGISINRPTLGDLPTMPGSECRQSLRECLQAGTDPATCADEARACVRKALTDEPDPTAE